MEHQIHLGIWHDIPIFIMCFGYQLLTPTHRFEPHTTRDRSKGKTRQLAPSELEEVTILWYEISGRCFLGVKTTPVNSISDNMCIYISLKLISCACGSNIFNINIQTFSDFPTLSNISEWFSQKKNLVFQHVPTLSNKPRKKQLGFPMACGHHLVTSGSPNPLGRHVVTNDILTAEIALGIPRPPISLPRV